MSRHRLHLPTRRLPVRDRSSARRRNPAVVVALALVTAGLVVSASRIGHDGGPTGGPRFRSVAGSTDIGAHTPRP